MIPIAHRHLGRSMYKVPDDSQIQLGKRFFLVGLDVVEFAVVAMFPLAPGKGIQAIKGTFDPSLARPFVPLLQEILPLKKLPLALSSS